MTPGPRRTSDSPQYWFPAKRYGWGWGIPLTWQGWVTLGLFGLAMLVGGLFIDVNLHPVVFAGYTFACSAGLVGVCAAKGEPPRWRWGKRSE